MNACCRGVVQVFLGQRADEGERDVEEEEEVRWDEGGGGKRGSWLPSLHTR